MRYALFALSLLLPLMTGTTRAQSPPPGATLLYSDDFNHGVGNWFPELEAGGTVSAANSELAIDVPAGATVWFRQKLTGPVQIEYEATAVVNGGANDRVSDLNCFWMATDSRSPAGIFGLKRSGKFSDYNQLLTYYASIGGNSNTTTRFRRYIGDATLRPLRPGDDLHGKDDLLAANVPQKITLIANGHLIQVYRNGKKLFEMNDPQPYTSGWFAFRTTHSHLVISGFHIYRLKGSE